MNLKQLEPKRSLNKAYLKEKVSRSNIELFKTNLAGLLKATNEKESEEHVKNNITKFLYDTYYNGKNQINTKGRIDLAIYEDSKPVVIIEAKRPSSSDMVTVMNLNAKAMHELILYYLRERIDEGNIDIKYLVATNVYEWFVFDASVFDKLFYKNTKLTKSYVDWKAARKASDTTDFFYTDIAAPFLKTLGEEIEFTWFDLRAVEKVVTNADLKDDNRLISLFKLLSPAHLLKQSFANDSNSLDTKFYGELLHIIGLEEKKDGGKKLIQRKEKPDPASFLENVINILTVEDRLHKLPKAGGDFGATPDERVFNVALELCITWINRILFLKLLEGQLLNYHAGNKSYRFLDFKTIPNYDELNKLFFQVLARKTSERTDPIHEKFINVPYLNSSLFEISRLEDDTLRINSLDDSLKLRIHSGTVLKTEGGKKREGEMPALQYLFEFLDAYDFSSEGTEEIQEENKSLINASVLGLIFEKINGYKDGSFFTPGFITMYMCRETIRRAVVQKFNETKGLKIEKFDELYNHIKDVKEANAIINSLRICDPAVGSGHFLVSALNEILAIKSELSILTDRDSKVLRDYSVEVINDELIVSINHDQLFEYKPGNKESQRVQEALFHEKQTLIENCLFGVDINPNSVKICRLRLWIELLKSAYYTAGSKYTELETLPNIDINIKQGNSLISRFALDADLGKVLKSIKYSIDDYRAFVNNYKNATDKDEKRGFEALIEQIKKDFRTEIGKNDPKVMLMNKRSGELFNLLNQARVFEPSEKEKKEREKKKEKLEAEINKLASDIKEIKDSAIYKNAFEWRFEFPEVLDKEGHFAGFDVLIGNPPYIRQEEIKEFSNYLEDNFKVFSGKSDIYVYFFERGLSLLRPQAHLSYITSGKYWEASYGKPLVDFVLKTSKLCKAINFNDIEIFDGVTAYPFITVTQKSDNGTGNEFEYYDFKELDFNNLADQLMKVTPLHINSIDLARNNNRFVDNTVAKLIDKLYHNSFELEEIFGLPIVGIKTGFNEGYLTESKEAKYIRSYIFGRDIKKYQPIKARSRIIYPYNEDYTLIELGKEPQINDILLPQKEKLSTRAIIEEGIIAGNKKWYEYQQINKTLDLNREFIVYPNVSFGNNFTLTTKVLVDMTGFVIQSDNRYLLGLLNSKLIEFLMNLWSVSRRGGYKEYKVQYLRRIPIKKLTKSEEKPFAHLVNKVLETKRADPSSDTSSLEQQIDNMVYALYALTVEEIQIVEAER